MKTEQEGLLKSCLHQLLKLKAASELGFGVYAKVVSNIFGKATKVLPSSHATFTNKRSLRNG
jgi:hypothetical protein